jgi:hypothetical protein
VSSETPAIVLVLGERECEQMVTGANWTAGADSCMYDGYNLASSAWSEVVFNKIINRLLRILSQLFCIAELL